MLRPGTIVPHPTTVSDDIKHLYVELSKVVRAYFKVCSNVLKHIGFRRLILMSVRLEDIDLCILPLMGGQHLT